jgi:hypothetical protein
MGRITEGIAYFNSKDENNNSVSHKDQLFSSIVVTPEMRRAKRLYLKELREENRIVENDNSTNDLKDIPYI